MTQEFVDEAGAGARVEVTTADVTCEPITGSFDIAVLKNLLQTLAADEARAVLANVGAALAPGGAIYILGMILDDSRLSPLGPVTNNLVFLNIYDGGQAYTEQEHRAWLTEAGFGNALRTTLSDRTPLIVARKPR